MSSGLCARSVADFVNGESEFRGCPRIIERMLSSSSSNTALVAAGIAGTIFLGYCIYFDRKRRSDPMYKQKVRERRQKAKRAKRNIIPPDTRDSDAVQKFFLQEVQLGETLLQLGEVEAAVEHLAAAVAICEQPQQLMEILQKTLPPPIFNAMLSRLPDVSKQLQRASMEEDVE